MLDDSRSTFWKFSFLAKAGEIGSLPRASRDAKSTSVPERLRVWSCGRLGKVIMFRPGQGNSGAVLLIR